MSGGSLFEAVARVRLPANVSSDSVIDEVEALAADLMVDIEFLDDVT